MDSEPINSIVINYHNNHNVHIYLSIMNFIDNPLLSLSFY